MPDSLRWQALMEAMSVSPLDASEVEIIALADGYLADPVWRMLHMPVRKRPAKRSKRDDSRAGKGCRRTVH